MIIYAAQLQLLMENSQLTALLYSGRQAQSKSFYHMSNITIFVFWEAGTSEEFTRL